MLTDGTIKHLHVVGHSDYRRDRRIVEFIGTAVDVTERKRAEEALRRSEAYLAEAQRLSHTGSWARNANGETTHSSEEHSRLYGFDPELGVPSFEAFAERIHPEARATVAETFGRAIGERTDFERISGPPAGRHVQLHSWGRSPCLRHRRELAEFIGTAVDVTERKRAEQALARSEKKLRDVIETIPAMAWTALPDGANDFANRMLQEFTGRSSGDATGGGWMALFHPADVASHIGKWRASLASGKLFENEARLRASDGEYRWFLHRAVPLVTRAAIFSSGMESRPKSTIASGQKPYSSERNGFSRWWPRGIRSLKSSRACVDSWRNKPAMSWRRSYYLTAIACGRAGRPAFQRATRTPSMEFWSGLPQVPVGQRRIGENR